MRPYRVLAEHDDHFEVDAGDGKPFRVAKPRLAHATVERIRKFAKGGEVPEDPGNIGPVSVSEEDAAGILGIPMPTAPAAAPAPGGQIQAVLPDELQTLHAPFQPVEQPAAAGPQFHNVQLAGQPSAAPAPKASDPFAPPAELSRGIAQEQAGIQQKASAMQAEGSAAASIADQLAQQREAMAQKFQAELVQHQQRADAMFQDIQSSKVDPNRFWNTKSTGQKIGASIGLILGGIGAGLTKGPNYALEVIEKQIDRDIESQKIDIGKKENLLTHYMQQGRDMIAAHQMAKADLLDVASAQLQKVAAQYQGQKAQADAQIAIGQLRTNAVGLRQQATERSIQIAQMQMSMRYQQAVMAQLTGAGVAGASPAKSLLMASFIQHPEKLAEHQVQVQEDVPTGATDTNGNPVIQTVARPYLGNSPESAKEARTALMHNRIMDRSLRELELFSSAHPLGGTPGSAAVGRARAALKNIKLNYEATMAGMNRQASPEVIKEMDDIAKDPTELIKSGRTSGAMEFLRKTVNEHKQLVLDTYTLGPM